MNTSWDQPLTIDRRFCGPPSSGNGGWTAGALAQRLLARSPEGSDIPIEVSLRMPPPLDRPLEVHATEDQLTLAAAGDTVATARYVERDLVDVRPVSVAQALAAEQAYPGLTSHPFPTCFVCGTGREPGDGLRLFTGPVPDQPADAPARSAATWTPDPNLADPDDGDRVTLAVTWAALDCVGGWAGDFGPRLMVLGRMTASVRSRARVGEQHVVVGERGVVDGRKTFTTATLRDSAGAVVGSAAHIWIAVDPKDFA